MAARSLGKVALTAGGIYSASEHYAPMTQVRGENATYLSIATSVGIPLTNTDYWQLVVQDGTTSQSGGGSTPVYLANYVLSGGAKAEAPTTIEDTSGNGNTMTVNSIATYDESGYLPIAAESASLCIPAINLGGRTDYTIHMKQAHGEMNGQHRFLHIPSNDLHMLLTNSSDNNTQIKIESANTDPGFTSPVVTSSFIPQVYRTSIRDYTMDIEVSGNQVTFIAEAKASDATVSNLRSTHTITGFSEHLAQGVYLGNRTDGIRPLGVALTEFWIRV